MPRETATDKAARIIRDKRIRFDRSASNPDRAVFRVVGDSDPLHPYTVTVERGRETCDCAFGPPTRRATCSHVHAARLILAAIDSKLTERSAR